MAQQVKNPTQSTRMGVRSLASLSGLRIRHCHSLQRRLQMQLQSDVAVAVVYAGGWGSNLTPSLGTSICSGGPKKGEKKMYLFNNTELYT